MKYISPARLNFFSALPLSSCSVNAAGTQLTVTTTNGAGVNHSAINWQSFSIGAGNATMGAKKLNFGFRATTSIKRSDFNIGAYAPVVSDKVDLTINAAFSAQ